MSNDEKEVAAAGESTVSQPTSPQGDLPPVPRNENKKEVAAVGESIISQLAPSQGIPPSAPRSGNEHRVTSILVWVDLCLVLATAALTYFTYKLAAVTHGEAQEGKRNTSALEKQAQQFDARLSELNKEVNGLKKEGSAIAHHILVPDSSEGGGARPSPANSPIVVGENFKNCSVTKKGEKWLLHEAELCYYLEIPLKNQDNVDYRVHSSIEFFRDDSSWRCVPPADRTIPADAVRDITLDLSVCFSQNQQERRGDIEFIIKTSAQEER